MYMYIYIYIYIYIYRYMFPYWASRMRARMQKCCPFTQALSTTHHHTYQSLYTLSAYTNPNTPPRLSASAVWLTSETCIVWHSNLTLSQGVRALVDQTNSNPKTVRSTALAYPVQTCNRIRATRKQQVPPPTHVGKGQLAKVASGS